jgi:hypothetical protein
VNDAELMEAISREAWRVTVASTLGALTLIGALWLGALLGWL